MNIQLAISVTGSGRPAAGSAPPTLTAIAADGWTGTWPSPPVIDPVGSPATFVVQRAGFTVTGQPTVHADAVTVTKRVRQPYPNQASLTASTVSLSDYVYAADTVPGVSNGSTAVSPKPVANWAMPDRLVVGNSVTLEVVAFHRDARNGEQVACVEFSASDGTTTVTSMVSQSVVSGLPGDQNAVIVYRAVLDVSTLANPALITCNAKVYPWFGTAASVRNSADLTAGREFSPRYFYRHVAKASAPPFAYVSTTGNDTTGVVSTTAATAAATPFQTVLGAIKGLKAATGVTGGRIDGCEVRLEAGSHVAGSLASGDVTGGIQDHAAVTITRSPSATRAQAVLTFGAAAFRTRFPYLRIRDCTILRTGTLYFQGETAPNLAVTLEDVTFDNASHNAAILSSASVVINGCALSNAGSSPIAAGANEVRMLRGLSCASGVNVENWLVLGSRLTGGAHSTSGFANGTRSSNGAIAAFNYFSGYRVTYGGLSETIALAVVQNVIEFFSATSNTGIGLSADGQPSHTAHAICHHNTLAGFFNNGRSNQFYDETAGQARTHSLMSSRGNIHVSVNNKGDVFLLDGTRTGNWPYLYGAGVASELHQFDAAAPNFRQEFAGLGSLVGTSTTTPISPLFTAPAHTTAGPTAGAGGGTYALQAGSPAKALVTTPLLRFDISGAARSLTAASAGAYE
jgi:hypothetical protein